MSSIDSFKYNSQILTKADKNINLYYKKGWDSLLFEHSHRLQI